MFCVHCQRLGLVRSMRACKCKVRKRAHFVCEDCAKRVPSKYLGDLLTEMEKAKPPWQRLN